MPRQSIDRLTAEQERALIECIKIFARRGRAIREERERIGLLHSATSAPEGSTNADTVTGLTQRNDETQADNDHNH